MASPLEELERAGVRVESQHAHTAKTGVPGRKQAFVGVDSFGLAQPSFRFGRQ